MYELEERAKKFNMGEMSKQEEEEGLWEEEGERLANQVEILKRQLHGDFTSQRLRGTDF